MDKIRNFLFGVKGLDFQLATSHFWQVVANVTLTITFVNYMWHTTHPDWMVLLVYGAVVSGNATLLQYLANRKPPADTN